MKHQINKYDIIIMLELLAPRVFELLVDQHDLFDGVNVYASVFVVHALHTDFFTNNNAVAIRHTNNINKIAQHMVENYFLIALMRKKMIADLFDRHVDFQLVLQS